MRLMYDKLRDSNRTFAATLRRYNIIDPTIIVIDDIETYMDMPRNEDWDDYIFFRPELEDKWKEFPCVVSPFKNCFIEMGGFGNVSRNGFLVSRYSRDDAVDALYANMGESSKEPLRKGKLEQLSMFDHEDFKWLIVFKWFVEKQKKIFDGGLQCFVPLTSDGMIIRESLIYSYNPNTKAYDYINEGNDWSNTDESMSSVYIRNDLLLARVLNPVFFALSLMNCKNIQMINNEPVLLTRKQKKRGEQPNTSYKTIKVLPIRKVYNEAESDEEPESGLMPLHICRGHFKDFRNGPGLFGKYREIFWWEQHVRGKAENGQVIKDYEVIAPTDE